ncbi:MAG: LTA synthase family protein [Wolinella sp.]
MKMFWAIFKIYLTFTVMFFCGRLLFYTLYFDRLSDISLGESLLTFIFGLRMDTIAISIILVIITLLLSLTPRRFAPYMSRFLHGYLLGFLLLALFVEIASFPFFAQYDLRPNYLFIEYLEYPKEVGSMIFKEYKLELLGAIFLVSLVAILYKKRPLVDFYEVLTQPHPPRIALLVPILALLFIGIRSSFTNLPSNISDALYSHNRIINEITKNSLHSIGYAYYSYKQFESDISSYGKIDLQEAYKIASEVLGIEYQDQKRPFYRKVKSSFKQNKPKNLVIFVQESLGAQFTGFIAGGKQKLTPNLDKLAQKYLTFNNLYANGPRSPRGLAAITSGTLPIAGDEVLTRNKSQQNYFTIASLLKPYGYKTSLIYGGDAKFDNMRSWYLGNGFERIVEEKDFTNPTFTSTWGVCDEDLVIKANEIFTEHHKNGEHFASVMFSSSNHTPFELPDGKIEFEKNLPRNSVENTVKYADFAIGRFIELAKQSGYFENTVFVIVADHNVRVHGNQVMPIDMFHIPAVIISEGLKPTVYDGLASQPDVLATALDLIGIDLSYPILGNSIFKENKQEVNLIILNETYAYRKHDYVVILVPNMPPRTFIYKDKQLIATKDDERLIKEAISLVYILDDMYKNQSYF